MQSETGQVRRPIRSLPCKAMFLFRYRRKETNLKLRQRQEPHTTSIRLKKRPMENAKICPTCRERPRHYNSGYCLECRRARDRARGSKPERKQSLQRSFAKWWEKNGAETRERHQQWLTDNADRQRQHRRNWTEKNKEIAAELIRDWKRNNPNRMRSIYHRRRALHMSAAGSFTADDIAAKLHKQNNHCFWCDGDMADQPTIDHYIPLSKGGSNFPENIVMACRSCNSSKRDKMPDEFIAYLKTKTALEGAA